jgi:hypothetical protein
MGHLSAAVTMAMRPTAMVPTSCACHGGDWRQTWGRSHIIVIVIVFIFILALQDVLDNDLILQ